MPLTTPVRLQHTKTLQPATDYSPIPRMSIEDFYVVHVQKTKEELQQEASYPQGSPEWLESRRYVFTASDFHAALGLSQYKTQDEFIAGKIHPTFVGNQATEWGSFHESDANKEFETYFTSAIESLYKACGQEFHASFINFYSLNLVRHEATCWMGVSPDRLVKWIHPTEGERTDLIEYKCPFKYFKGHPYAKHANNIPDYYMTQMQGIAGYLGNIHTIWFVVWTPKTLWITHVPVDFQHYNSIVKELKHVYFTKFLPALVSDHGVSDPSVSEPPR